MMTKKFKNINLNLNEGKHLKLVTIFNRNQANIYEASYGHSVLR